MASISQIYCSISTCKQPAVVTRWYVGIGPYPPMMVHLCLDCKKIPPWDEENDLIKEERIENEKIV